MSEAILTEHAKDRIIERGISVHDAKQIAKNGQIEKTEIDGTIVRQGTSHDGRVLTVITIKSPKNKIIIKTAYYEN